MKKNKKPLYITLFCLDALVTIGLLVISIIMLVMTGKYNAAIIEDLVPSNLIEFFIKNPLVYGLTCVLPLFLILATNIIVLIIYVKRTTKAEKVKVSDLSDEQKEALKAELLKELNNDK